jgi:hypothetical protein
MAPYIQSMTGECLSPACTERCSLRGVGNLTVAEEAEGLTGYYVGISGWDYGCVCVCCACVCVWVCGCGCVGQRARGLFVCWRWEGGTRGERIGRKTKQNKCLTSPHSPPHNATQNNNGTWSSTPPCDDACESQDLELLKANVAESGPASVCVNAATWNDYVEVWGCAMKKGGTAGLVKLYVQTRQTP